MSANGRNWLQAATRAEPVPLAVELPAAVEETEPGEDVHPSRAYGGVWSRRDRTHTVEFRFLDPEKPDESFDYNYLPRVSWHKGKGEIALIFDTLGLTVRIRGLNLVELKERLRQHLVTWVQEQGNDPVATKLAREEARTAGQELVLVQEIGIEPHKVPSDVPY
ncbi:hypothetical protein [Fimbriiglobus ruber]|uniref:Uncharacterized protein n=1 Tax=Fimbriiglobus ruber TaxID=1908690 RepID=A0A225DVL0_9BACT|nr:hypothetical protein [Fimbriiglobus ruber]OWK45580.1 hypothetical protein FRUB_01911 [Fimbriiglobus ruber]